MLSNIPLTLPGLKTSNDYGASLVSKYSSRYGLLAAHRQTRLLPWKKSSARRTTCTQTVLQSLVSITTSLSATPPSTPSGRNSTTSLQPSSCTPTPTRPVQGRPAPLIKVAFEIAHTVVDLLYAATFRRFPHSKWIISHCGGALPVLFGRLQL
jgi:6-methylsalicylate decarboxylase